MQAENPEIKYEALLEQTYKDDYARARLMLWLESKQIFRASDAKLVNTFVNTACQLIPKDNREAMRADRPGMLREASGRGTFAAGPTLGDRHFTMSVPK